jgi:type 1 glutamine amidotransferase
MTRVMRVLTPLHTFLIVALVLLLAACTAEPKDPAPASSPEDQPFIVFVTGDEEYRSEESMPMLARMLEREMGVRTRVCYALDSAGYVNPNINDNIVGLEALDSADMMVMFTRWRALPDDQAKHILDFAESGKPMVGFRTATHAFLYKDDSLRQHLNNEWPTKVFGQQWITHHGHFEDGNAPLTSVTLVEGKADHPILRGVEPMEAYSWLYHVDGGEWELYGDSDPLLTGRSLRSNHEEAGRLDEFPLTNPVAWTKTYTGTSEKAARVFFTTLGHPYDFKSESMRKLAMNGVAWAMGREDNIPADGFDPTIVGTYDPNNSGFGEKFKKGLRPE